VAFAAVVAGDLVAAVGAEVAAVAVVSLVAAVVAVEEFVGAVVVAVLMQDVKDDVLAEEKQEAWTICALPYTLVAVDYVGGAVEEDQNIEKTEVVDVVVQVVEEGVRES